MSAGKFASCHVFICTMASLPEFSYHYPLFCLRYRAKILSTEPMTIQFIDFGNVSSVSPEGVAPLPPLLSAIPPLVSKTCLNRMLLRQTFHSNWCYMYLFQAIRVKLQSETNICPSVGDELCVNYISSVSAFIFLFLLTFVLCL